MENFSVTLTTLDGTQHEAAIGNFITLAGARAYARVWIRSQVELAAMAETEGETQAKTPLAAVVWNVHSDRVAAIIGHRFHDKTQEV